MITGYGVNLFVFISGYYRIRLSLRSVTKLYFYMVFYQLILCALGRYALATDMGSFAGCFSHSAMQGIGLFRAILC